MLRYILLLQYVPYAVIRLLLSSQNSNHFLVIINRRLIRYLKECILTYISMNIIEKVFKYEQTDLPIIKYKDEIWFRGKTVAEILGYAIQRKAIREHADPEDKRKLSELGLKSKQNETDPLKSPGGGVLAMLGYPGMCHFPGYTSAGKF